MKEIFISDDPYQSHTITYEDKKIEIEARFLVTASMWYFDILLDDAYLVKGMAMSCGMPLLMQNNKPFGFLFEDQSPLGIDAFRLDDFANGRIVMYFLEREDMIALRGRDVQ